MLKGEEPKVCKKCFDSERSGTWSYRQSMNSKYPELVAEIANHKNVKPKLDPVFLDLRIGNKCNLSCRMCSPYSSHQLLREWNDFYQKKIAPKAGAEEVLLELPQSWENVRLINFAGGEPLISKRVLQNLKSLVESGKSSQIQLRFNTNLTHLDEEILATFNSFSSVELIVSLDGFSSLNDYIRYPSKWNQIIANLKTVTSRFAGSPVQVRFNLTVQIYNVFSIVPLLRFLEAEYSQEPSLNLLTDPKYFCIQSLPSEMKDLAESRLRNEAKDFSGISLIETIIRFMRAQDSSQHFQDFIRWTRHFDQSRGQSIEGAVPELKGYFR